MFSASTPTATSGRRAGSAAVRRSQSRAGSIAALAQAEGTPPSTAKGTLNTRRGTRATSSRRQSLLPGGRTPSRATSRAGTAGFLDEDASGEAESTLLIEDESESLGVQGVLLKSDTHSVSILGGLPGSFVPPEVKEVLARSDFYSGPHTAVLDANSGCACLVGKTQCYAWSISRIHEASSGSSSSTCYTFPVPPTPALSLSTTIFSPAPFVAFVSMEGRASSSSSGREPGFLMITTWGQAIYWGSISAALSGVERNDQQTLPLVQGEVVRAVERLSATRYVLSTSGSRLFSIRINTSFSHSASMTIKPVSKSSGMLSRMGGFFGAAVIDPQGGLTALTSCRRSTSTRGETEWAAFAVSDRVIQQWVFTETREEFGGDVDAYEDIEENLSSALGIQSGSFSSLNIVDAQAISQSQLVLLTAFSIANSGQPASSRRRLAYALVTLEEGRVVSTKTLSYDHELDPRPLSAPHLTLSSAAGLCFVSFPDLVIATSINSSLSFEESVSLKDAARDRILGSMLSTPTGLVMLAAHTGLILVDVDVEYIKSLARETKGISPSDLATRNLKSKLEQAVLFADSHDNPLAFDLTLTNEAGDLVSAAESVSADILRSSSPNLPTIIDLRAQLADRAARLRYLMKYIQDNNLISRLSKMAKRHLAWDAEKLVACQALWHAQNSSHDLVGTNILGEAVEALKLPQAIGEDDVRSFFRHHADQTGDMLEQMLPLLEHRVLPSTLPLKDRSIALQHIDRVLCRALKAASRHRVEQGNLYGIPVSPDSQTCLSAPWTSTPALLELLRSAFDATDSILVERRQVIGSNVDDDRAQEYGSAAHMRKGTVEEEREVQHLLKSYLVELADYALAMHQERMSYLQSLGDDAKAVAELRSLLDMYVHLRPQVINSMVRLSRPNAAYDLAERYRDFRSLVILCNDASIGSPARVHFYIEKYKEEFAFALYDWYLESGRSYDLMTQDSTYGGMLSKFLQLRDIPRLAWMQDIDSGRVQDASAALLRHASAETRLSEQKLMLSLGKLAQVSSFTRNEVSSSERVQLLLESIDDRLDLVASHDRLLSLCRDITDARDTLKPVETQATVAVGRLCSRVTSPAVIKLASFLFRRLLLGDALLPEDLVDLYSLKDNTSEEQVNDFAYALEILSRDQSTPRTRQTVINKAVWRRVYLRDDYVNLRRIASSSTDEVLAQHIRGTALYATLRACYKNSATDTVKLRPTEALYLSTPDEEASVQARFSSSIYDGQIDIEAIAREYARESRLIEEMSNDKLVRLGEFFDEAQRLVSLDEEQINTEEQILAGIDDSLMQG